MPSSPCALAVHLADGLPDNLTPAQAIHEALKQLDDWEWTGGSAIDFTGLAPCETCDKWMPDTREVDGHTYCDNEQCLPEETTDAEPR